MYFSRVRGVRRVYYLFVTILASLTIFMLWATWMTFRIWQVETSGVWTTGEIIGITHCYDDRDHRELATINLEVSFTDTHGINRVSQTDCQYDTVKTGEHIVIGYLPNDPSYILTHEDIGGGQGSVLVVLIVLDSIGVMILTVVAVLAIRAHRRLGRVRPATKAMVGAGTGVLYRARRGQPGSQSDN